MTYYEENSYRDAKKKFTSIRKSNYSFKNSDHLEKYSSPKRELKIPQKIVYLDQMKLNDFKEGLNSDKTIKANIVSTYNNYSTDFPGKQYMVEPIMINSNINDYKDKTPNGNNGSKDGQISDNYNKVSISNDLSMEAKQDEEFKKVEDDSI